jgi:acid phosphatase class B
MIDVARNHEREDDNVMSTAIPGEVWKQMVATFSTRYDVVTFLTQRTCYCSNFVAISSLVSELLKKWLIR